MPPLPALTLARCPLLSPPQQFNSTNHDFEITLQRDSAIELCAPDDDEARAIPEIQFNVSGGGRGEYVGNAVCVYVCVCEGWGMSQNAT